MPVSITFYGLIKICYLPLDCSLSGRGELLKTISGLHLHVRPGVRGLDLGTPISLNINKPKSLFYGAG